MIKNIHHVHTMYSLNDSTMSPDDMVKRAREMGCENISLTDHGTLLGVEPFMEAGRIYGVNTIPGVEAYTKNRCHLVLVAKDYTGFQAIAKALKDANSHIEKVGNMEFPIMTEDILEKYFSGNAHVIASSACIKGELGTILLRKRKAEQLIHEKESELNELKEKHDMWNAWRTAYLEAAGKVKSLKQEKKEFDRYTKAPFHSQIERLKAQLKKTEFHSEKGLELDAKIRSAVRLQQGAIQQIQNISNLLDEWTKKRNEAKKMSDRLKGADERYRARKKEMKEHRIPMENDLFQEAKERLTYYKSIFPEFYIEIQYHGSDDEKYVMEKLIQLARETDTPLIATNDAHMVDNSADSIEARRIVRYNYFRRSQQATAVDRELYLKTDAELTKAIAEVAGMQIARKACENLHFMESCKVVFPTEKHYPSYSRMEDGDTFDSLLERKSVRWMKKVNGIKPTRTNWPMRGILSKTWDMWTII